jgi:hypothetical protein
MRPRIEDNQGCLVCLGFVVVPFALAAVVVSLFLTYHCHDAASMEEVSGFYGPGTFIAWCITTVSTLATTDFNPAAQSTSSSALGTPEDDDLDTGDARTPPQRLPETEEVREQESKSEYDPGLLATLGYPIVASGDVLLRIGTDKNPSQLRAALAVVQVAQVICIITLGIIVTLTWTRPFRLHAWGATLMICSGAMCLGTRWELGCDLDNDSLINAIMSVYQTGFLPVVAGLGAITAIIKGIVAAKKPKVLSLILFLLSVLAWLIYALISLGRMGELEEQCRPTCEHRLRSAVPKSNIRITDLDQAAALGIALICSAVMPALLAACRHLREHAKDFGRCLKVCLTRIGLRLP